MKPQMKKRMKTKMKTTTKTKVLVCVLVFVLCFLCCLLVFGGVGHQFSLTPTALRVPAVASSKKVGGYKARRRRGLLSGGVVQREARQAEELRHGEPAG